MTYDPLTGTHFSVTEVSPGAIALKLSFFQGDRFLEGWVRDGTVGLAKVSGPFHSGTFWEPIITNHIRYQDPALLNPSEFDVWILRCLGAIDLGTVAPSFPQGDVVENRFLAFRSADNSIGLAPFIDGVFAGLIGGPMTATRWIVIKKSRQGACTGRRRIVVLVDRWKDRRSCCRPRKARTKPRTLPAQAAGLKRQKQIAPARTAFAVG